MQAGVACEIVGNLLWMVICFGKYVKLMKTKFFIYLFFSQNHLIADLGIESNDVQYNSVWQRKLSSFYFNSQMFGLRSVSKYTHSVMMLFFLVPFLFLSSLDTLIVHTNTDYI